MKCECCGTEGTTENRLGYCEVAKKWVCTKCCYECYKQSFPYGCPTGVGLNYDKEVSE